MQLTVTHNSKTFANFDRHELEAAGVPADVIAEAEALVAATDARGSIRREIDQTAGDTLSILGTASDGAQLIIYQLSKLAKSLSEANSLAEMRAAALPLADLTAGFLAGVESGDVKLTCLVKGEAQVITDIEQRATAVAEVFERAQG